LFLASFLFLLTGLEAQVLPFKDTLQVPFPKLLPENKPPAFDQLEANLQPAYFASQMPIMIPQGEYFLLKKHVEIEKHPYMPGSKPYKRDPELNYIPLKPEKE